MYIYWLENQRRCGPATVPDVLSKLHLGELTWDTPGWHSGCQEWLPLRCLPALADFAELGTPPTKTEEEPPQPKPKLHEASLPVQPVRLPTPMARFAARVMDCTIYATMVLGVAYALGLPFHPYLLPGHPLFWVGMPVLEALLLRIWRTTPGKRWVGIRVTCAGGAGYLTMLGRSLCVFVFGMGCMLPLFMPIMCFFSYINVRRRGLARWDTLSGVIPVALPTAGLATVVFMIPFILLCMHLCSYFVFPWLPDMIQLMQEQNPQAAEFIQRLMGN